MPTMKCPGCAADIEYKKGEWRVKCPAANGVRPASLSR